MSVTEIQSAQYFGALCSIVEELKLNTVTEDFEVLRYSSVIRKWQSGEVFAVGNYCRYNYDNNNYPMVYRIKNQHVAQANITPDGEHSGNLYELVGYENGYRIWSKPYREIDSYYIERNNIVFHNGVWYQNLKDDNRFEPTADSPVWEVIEVPTV